MKLKQINKAWYFLLIVILFYLTLFFINKNYFITSTEFFFNILKTIIPVFVLVFILMTLVNYFVTNEIIIKHFGQGKIKAWIFAVAAGIISHGPTYMWYPLLAEAKNKGANAGLIACFLYNRAIKIPLLPMLVFYFGIKYVFILTSVMIFMSVIQGIFINKIIEKGLS